MLCALLLTLSFPLQEPSGPTVEKALATLTELQAAEADDYDVGKALIALARIKDPAAAAAIFELLDDFRGPLRGVAIIALGNCKTDNRYELLGTIVSKSKKQPDRISAASVLVKTERGREWLRQRYKKLKDAPVKAMLIASFESQSDEKVKLILKAVKDKNPQIKARALRIAAQWKLMKVLKLAIKSLEDSNLSVRRSAAIACGIFGGADSFTALIEQAAEARGPELRSGLRRGLKSAQTAEEIGLIAQAMLKLRKPEAKGLLAQSMIVSGPRQPAIAGPAFAKLLEDKDAGLRTLALRGIEATRNELALPLLIELLDHEEFLVRSDAVRALGSFRNVPVLYAEKIASLSHDESRAVRLGATMALQSIPADMALASLEARLLDEDWAVRDVAVEVLAQMRSVPAARLLAEHMQRATGLVRDETYQYLKAMTGKDFGPAPQAWGNWIKDRPDDYQLPTLEEAQIMLTELKKSRNINSVGYHNVQYHGLAIRPGNVLFILDISGSMGFNYTPAGQLFHDYFTNELITTLKNLGGDHRFNIVYFSSGAQAWEKDLIDVNEENIERAIAFVKGLHPGGATNLASAMEFPFKMHEVQQVFLMTDGDPTVGTTLKSAIVDRIVEQNRTRRIRINTIVAGDVDGNFLAEIAALNGGHSVDLRKGFEEEYEDEDDGAEADPEQDQGGN
jgi:HEAT repeat protein